MQLGPEIRRRRKALGLTLEALAHKSGLSPHYLSNLEVGAPGKAGRTERDPSLSTLVAVSTALGTTPGELLGGSTEIPPVAVEAARLFAVAPAEVQEGVLQILRAVAPRRRR